MLPTNEVPTLLLVSSFLSLVAAADKCLEMRGGGANNVTGPVSVHKEYDFFILAQSWPVVSCNEWKAKKAKNGCNLPGKDENKMWTIHGLWPSKKGTFEPQNCDETDKFQMSQVCKKAVFLP